MHPPGAARCCGTGRAASSGEPSLAKGIPPASPGASACLGSAVADPELAWGEPGAAFVASSCQPGWM